MEKKYGYGKLDFYNVRNQTDFTSHNIAKFWQKENQNGENTILCVLCPRKCYLRKGQKGYCGVRKNNNGKLIALNYGVSLIMCEERIEVDGIFHFKPGSRTLALGGLGCSLHCDFCQNWAFSQMIETYRQFIRHYTPEEIVETALEHGIKILSWTYNEPMVWHEFIMDTAKIAHENGIQNLINSSFFISIEPLEDLINVIDIFAFSLKSLNDSYYRNVCKGWIKPVLEAAEILHKSGRHVEFKNLMVEDLNDSDLEINELLDWFVNNIGIDVPLHFVSAHPDYKLIQSKRPSIKKLENARKAAIERGIKYCYLGNLFKHPGLNTYCPECGKILIERLGVGHSKNYGVIDGKCSDCGEKILIVHNKNQKFESNTETKIYSNLEQYKWGKNLSIHVEVLNKNNEKSFLKCVHIDQKNNIIDSNVIKINRKSEWRQMIPKLSELENKIKIYYNAGINIRIYEVKDRAQYPLQLITNSSKS